MKKLVILMLLEIVIIQQIISRKKNKDILNILI